MVPVGDVLVKPSRIFFRISSDFSPFMFQVRPPYVEI